MPHRAISRLLSGSPGTMAGPVLPPLSAASRESSRSPPEGAVPVAAHAVFRQDRPDVLFEEFGLCRSRRLGLDLWARKYEERQRPEGRQRKE
jgi:hypothetical protein